MASTEIAVTRFGLGARPGELSSAAGDPRGWLRAQLVGEVPRVGASTLAPSDQILVGLIAARERRREMATAAALAPDRSADQAETVSTALNLVREAYQPHYRAQVLARAQSAVLTERPFAERLVHFWSNHFAISADKGSIFGLAGTLENEAIRPRVNGRFVELLLAVEQHPAMIAFLDNQYSIGVHSAAAQAAAWRATDAMPRRQLGTNENLAREILELHTLGVDGGYTQQDVTTFAQMITGWSIGGGKGRLMGGEPGRFFFRDNQHEPGPKTFLGKIYAKEGRPQGEAALVDLARRPATARHIASKLARHFIADDAPPAAVERIARAFRKSDGDLGIVYAALIDSPEAWNSAAQKFKTPEDFVFSTLRGFGLAPERAEDVVHTFDLLGQRQYMPGSPAGWPDVAQSWDGSDALMHRVLWASRVAKRFERGVDPIDFAMAALGSRVRSETLAALKRASTAAQALALVLLSPEFQRR